MPPPHPQPRETEGEEECHGGLGDGVREIKLGLRFDRTARPTQVPHTLGRSTYQGDYDGDAYVGECKWAFKRVITTDPEVEPCVAED